MKTLSFFYHYIKKNWLTIFIVLAVILFVTADILQVITPRVAKPGNQPNTWKSITPNYSKISDVYKAFGQPLETKKIDQGTQLSYKSVFPALPNQVVVDPQEKVSFMKEQTLHVDGGNISNYTTKYGKADLVMFDAETGPGDRAYVFLSKGLVIVAHVGDGSVEQRWYFTPTNQDNFLKIWGTHLSFNENPDQL